MDQRKSYTVDIGGIQHDMLLTEQGARRYGDRAQLRTITSTPEVEPEVETKKVTPANKGRSARNKSTD